jgi:DNA-binding transcriptional LysR family regulator
VELRHLRYFVAVAEELHFGKAAERLHIVQPALSKQILLLERELGVQLLERTKRHVQLTHAGVAFLEDARRTLAQAEMAVEHAHLAGRGERGVLRIGFIAPAVYHLLPRTLRAYRTSFPDVRLRLSEVSNRAAIDGVTSGHLDLAFVRLPIEDDLRLCRVTVSEEPVMLALPAGHELAEQAEVDLRWVAKESFVMISRAQEPALYDHYVAWCLEAGFSPQVVHEVDRTHVAVGLVAGGMGVAFVPTCAQAMAHPGVAYRPLREPAPRLVMGALWRSDGGSAVLAGFLAMEPWVTVTFPAP